LLRELDPAVRLSALMVPVVDDNFPEKSSAIGKNKVHKPTFKGVWYVAVNFALLSLRRYQARSIPKATGMPIAQAHT